MDVTKAWQAAILDLRHTHPDAHAAVVASMTAAIRGASSGCEVADLMLEAGALRRLREALAMGDAAPAEVVEAVLARLPAPAEVAVAGEPLEPLAQLAAAVEAGAACLPEGLREWLTVELMVVGRSDLMTLPDAELGPQGLQVLREYQAQAEQDFHALPFGRPIECAA